MRAFALALLFACAAATPAAADRFALEYQGLALGVVNVGEMTVDADVSDDTYEIAMTMRSGGLLNLFERTRISASSTGRIQNGTVFWQRYELDHHYSRKHRTIALTAGPDGAVTREITPNYRLWGDPPASDDQIRRSRDPMSTLMSMAIDVGLTRRCSGVYPTFDGRFHYLLELTGGEIDDFDSGGYDGPVLKCSLAYIAVSGFERSDAGRRRIPEGQVWFALVEDSNFSPPVRIQTPLSAGGATIRLSSWRRANVSIANAP
jgi:Protein of unknown function (DUF3108)